MQGVVSPNNRWGSTLSLRETEGDLCHWAWSLLPTFLLPAGPRVVIVDSKSICQLWAESGRGWRAQLPRQAGAVTLAVLMLSHPKSEREDTTVVLLIVFFSRRHWSQSTSQALMNVSPQHVMTEGKAISLLEIGNRGTQGWGTDPGPTGNLSFRMRTNPWYPGFQASASAPGYPRPLGRRGGTKWRFTGKR